MHRSGPLTSAERSTYQSGCRSFERGDDPTALVQFTELLETRDRFADVHYRVGVLLEGSSRVGPDGYVVDFTAIKKIVTHLCKSMNERFIVPMRSDVLTIDVSSEPDQVKLLCEDGARFSFPRHDVARLAFQATNSLGLPPRSLLNFAMSSYFFLKKKTW